MDGRHDEDVCSVAKPAERVKREHVGIEGGIGAHLAVILKIDAALVENVHGLDDAFAAIAPGKTESRGRKQRNAQLEAEAVQAYRS